MKKAKGKLYVLIDECDSFVNTMVVERGTDEGAVIVWRALCSFLETLKVIGGMSMRMRSFITGITPLAFAEASGYNVAQNLTHTPSVLRRWSAFASAIWSAAWRSFRT